MVFFSNRQSKYIIRSHQGSKKEFFGGKFEPDRCTCYSAAGCNVMVIINRLNNVLLEDMKDSDWTAGTYEEVLAKYNGGSIDDFFDCSRS